MKPKAKIQFIQDFQRSFNLVRTGKVKGIQLRLGEEPGQTIANFKGVRSGTRESQPNPI